MAAKANGTATEEPDTGPQGHTNQNQELHEPRAGADDGPGVLNEGRWSEYTQLSRQIKQAGLLDRRRGWYAARTGSNLALLAGGWTIFLVLVLSPLQALAFVVVQQGLFGLYLGCASAPNHAVRHLHAVGAPLRLAPATD